MVPDLAPCRGRTLPGQREHVPSGRDALVTRRAAWVKCLGGDQAWKQVYHKVRAADLASAVRDSRAFHMLSPPPHLALCRAYW